MKHTIIENKSYTTQMYEYKGYKIWRTHSTEPFRIEKDNKIIYYFKKYDNPKQFNKISLNMIYKLIDNNELEKWYKIK